MFKFKLNPIAAACAVALGLAAGPALAADLDADLVQADVEVFLSGASAPQNTLSAIAGQLFEAGYRVFYSDGGDDTKSSDDGVDYRAFFGTIKAEAPAEFASLVGKKVLLVNRAKGGSVWGVNPVARAQAIATMAVSDANCQVKTNMPAGVEQLCTETGSDTNPNDPGNRVPDFGVSDVAPNMFKLPLNVEAGADQLSAEETARLTVKGVYTIMMGLVATDGVPFGTYLSKADYASILTGAITDFHSINPSLPLGTKPVVCRRVNGSGTQASYNWFFHNFPCTSGSIAGTGSSTPLDILSNIDAGSIVGGSGAAGDPLIIDPTAGTAIIENSGSGNVRACLAAAAAGNDYSHSILFDDGSGVQELHYTVQFSKSGVNTPAIGVLSLDSRTKENGWTFRSLDGAGHIDPTSGDAVCDDPANGECGVFPIKAKLLAGDYEFASESTMQYRNTLVNGVAAPAGDELTFIEGFITASGSPTIIEAIPKAAVRDASAALPIIFDASDPFVADATRNGNMCAPLQKKI